MTAPPAVDEIEVTLLGPGRGEGIVVHYGDGSWMVVDSCIKRDGRPAALAYLDSIGVSPDAVTHLVATHWHDDHIRGFGELVRNCPGSAVVISAALECDEFFMLAASEGAGMISGSSGVRELAHVLRRTAQSGQPLELARADQRLILRATSAGIPSAEVWALSPSSATLIDAVREFAALAPIVGQSKGAVPRPERNPHCVVLWIEVGHVRAVLGADLERETKSDRGWTAIVDSTARPHGSCHFVKIPHHGSGDAHDERMWSELLVPSPHAGLTPFRQGRVALPRATDTARIANLTDQAWLTRASPDSRSPTRPRAVERTITEMSGSLRMTSVEPGRVTFRCDAQSPGNWSVDAPPPAVRLTA